MKIKLLLITLLIAGCGGSGDWKNKLWPTNPENDDANPDEGGTNKLQLTANLEMFESCDQIQEHYYNRLVKAKEDALKQQKYWDSIVVANEESLDDAGPVSAQPDAPGSGSSGQKTAKNNTDTNEQEAGVGEADFVKITKDHIYVLVQDHIEVLDRASLSKIGNLDFSKNVDNVSGVEMYATNERLVVILSTYQNHYWGTKERKTNSLVLIYKSSKGALPELLGQKSIYGSISHTRLVGNRLVTVSQSQLEFAVKQGYRPYLIADQDVVSKPLKIEKGNINGFPCTSVAKPIKEDIDYSITGITTINIENVEDTDHKIALNMQPTNLYMTQENIYLSKQGMSWSFFTVDEDFVGMQLTLAKIAFDKESGEISPKAIGKLRGYVKDQWAFKELADQESHEKFLMVAVSTGTLWGGRGNTDSRAQNHLYSLKQDGFKLEIVSEINDYGTDENIRAIRYVGNTAYVVTFRQTDPLYAFDISNPRNLKTLGELKVPGFSTYLHPLADGRLLGVGYDAIDHGDWVEQSGVQVSLFDTEDKGEMDRIDNFIYGDRGSFSDVILDHHAFFFDEDSGLVSIPLVNIKQSNSTRNWNPKVVESGSKIYSFNGDRITELGNVSHLSIIPSECKKQMVYGQWSSGLGRSLDINRVYKIDNRLVSFSTFGMKLHDMATLEDIGETLKFDVDLKDGCYFYRNFDHGGIEPMPVPIEL